MSFSCNEMVGALKVLILPAVLGFLLYLSYQNKPEEAASDTHLEGANEVTPVQDYISGQAYYRGIEVERDYIKAAEYYRRASDAGHYLARASLAHMHLIGRGVKKDTKMSVDLYLSAAKSPHDLTAGLANYNLGAIFINGDGIAKDVTKAKIFFERAIKSGNTDAEYSLANMYYEGLVGPQDYGKAFELYERAARKGDPRAQNDLGVMYYNGWGTHEKNYFLAFAYWEFASRNESDNGTRMRDEMYETMNLEQKRHAQKIVEDLIRKNPKLIAE